MTTEQAKLYRQQRYDNAVLARQQICDKIADGRYVLESVPCFCGADESNDYEIQKLDRDNIPHRVVVCKACGMARANPRLTAEGYASFYNDEYRKFTYRWLGTDPEDREHELRLIREKQRGVGLNIQQHINNEDIDFPRTILDFGCYTGGVLDHFKELGCETYGIEINEEAIATARANGHTIFTSIDEMIDLGIKVDFIIMQDVVEHLLDLRDVKRFREVLKPEGYIYIFTPGLFRTDPKSYWQLAHTWYFVASTFGWMMEELGFVPTYIDEDITSFWQWRSENPPPAPPPAEWADYIIDEAAGLEERKLPPFRGVCKFTKKLLYDNMRKNFALKPPDMHCLFETATGPIAVIGGGPSIDGQIDELKALVANGVPTIAIARMYPWCLAHGITPTYVVSLDCMEEQEKGFVQIDKSTTHLMASVTRPELVDRIMQENAPLFIFDSRDDRKIKNLRRAEGYEVATVINSGGTVVLTCISLALTIGFNELHIFGFDCMLPDHVKTHADGIAGESVPQRALPITIDGESILTTPSFLEFARQALDLFAVAHDTGMLNSVHVYGTSLITKMWDCKWWNEDGTEQGATNEAV